jgi:hypothetical protein
MGDSEKEMHLKWILESYGDISLARIVDRFQKILGIDLDNDEYDLESELAKYLERDLSENEIFRLRPILMDIYDNYYGEE